MYVRPILPQTDDARVLRDAVQKELDRLAVEFRGVQDGRLVSVRYATEPPTQGKNAVGDVIRNSVLTEVTSGISPPYLVIGWVCTVAGEPGTWEEIRTETDYTLSVYGWEDALADISAGRGIGVTAPTWATFRNGIKAYSFDASTMNEIWVNLHITHNYAPGSKIYPHIHWSTTGTNTGVVRWGIEYTAQKGHNQGAFPETTTIYLEQAASGTAYQHMIVEAGEQDAFNTNLEVDSIIMMRVFRDATSGRDTCADAAFGFFVDAHYQVDRAYGTKNRAPNFYSGNLPAAGQIAYAGFAPTVT